MKTAKLLKEKIHSGDLTVGVMATFHCWPGLVEILLKAEVDYLIVDLEHTTHDAATVSQTCAMGRMVGLPVLIRPPATEPHLMALALDAGAVGMLLPYVETIEDMNRIQDAIYLPPRGRRRPGGAGTFWISGYHYDNWKSEVEDDLIILPQIESREGLKNVETIARHEMTTAIAIGPYDLSADLGICWQPDHPKLLEAAETVRSAGKKAGKNMWNIGNAGDLKKRGYTFFCATEASMFLQIGLKEMVETLRKDGVTIPTSEAPLP
jgi:2-keto-3-deoxy-L-rhamnonate aldolase RhmA